MPGSIIRPRQLTELEAAFPALAKRDPVFFQKLCNEGVFTTLDRHQVICEQGISCSHLALLIDGTARVYKLGENGREITLYRIGRGESCILTASCILSHEPFPAIAVCESPIHAFVIPAGRVNQWLSESPSWRDYVFSLVARRLSDIISTVEEVAFKRVDQRIVEYLLERSSEAITKISITHQQIASDLGTSREVVSRILKDLENANLLQISRGTITIINHTSLLNKRQK